MPKYSRRQRKQRAKARRHDATARQPAIFAAEAEAATRALARVSAQHRPRRSLHIPGPPKIPPGVAEAAFHLSAQKMSKLSADDKALLKMDEGLDKNHCGYRH